MTKNTRLEKDLLGELKVPKNAYWGINTQRTLLNFNISQRKFPEAFIKSLAKVKLACLFSNKELGVIDNKIAKAIKQAITEILDQDKFLDQFPVDVFQTGSGTQINMNMNEVVANRGNEILGHPKGKKTPIHPNDHVNKSQSSNDVIPTTMHIVTIELLEQNLIPKIEFLLSILTEKIAEFEPIVKVGRTHLQDAVPIKLATEFLVYNKQLQQSIKRLENAIEELSYLSIGGTAVGTGLNAPKDFDKLTIKHLSKIVNKPLKLNLVKAEGISSHNTIVKVSSDLKLLALSLMKMANDIRWMGSGPRAGLSELVLPQNEPGSSIMPGKINPTQAEALIQVCLQVIGNDTTITFAENSGSILDLNVTKPVMIINLLDSIELLTNGIESFTEKCLKGLKADTKNIDKQLEQILMVVTKLTPIIGYEKAGEIAAKAYAKGKTIKEILKDYTFDSSINIDELLDPKNMV